MITYRIEQRESKITEWPTYRHNPIYWYVVGPDGKNLSGGNYRPVARLLAIKHAFESGYKHTEVEFVEVKMKKG